MYSQLVGKFQLLLRTLPLRCHYIEGGTVLETECGARSEGLCHWDTTSTDTGKTLVLFKWIAAKPWTMASKVREWSKLWSVVYEVLWWTSYIPTLLRYCSGKACMFVARLAWFELDCHSCSCRWCDGHCPLCSEVCCVAKCSSLFRLCCFVFYVGSLA